MIVAVLEQSDYERSGQMFLVDTSKVQDAGLKNDLETKNNIQPDFDLWQIETDTNCKITRVKPPQMVERLVNVWLGDCS